MYSDQINEAIKEYGWSCEPTGAGVDIIYNSKGVEVVRISYKGNAYTFKDTAGNKLMSGKGQLIVSTIKLLTEFYYCKSLKTT
jgi:hypothetical protein